MMLKGTVSINPKVSVVIVEADALIRHHYVEERRKKEDLSNYTEHKKAVVKDEYHRLPGRLIGWISYFGD